MTQKLHDPRGGIGIEIPGRLVGQEESRFVHQGASDSDPLLLPSAELVGKGVGAVRHAHHLQSSRHLVAYLLTPHSDHTQRECDILVDCLARQQSKVLKDDAEFTPKERNRMQGDRVQVFSGDHHTSGSRLLFPIEKLQEGRFACPSRSDNEHELALLYAQTEVRQGERVIAISYRHILKFYHIHVIIPANRQASDERRRSRQGSGSETACRSRPDHD